MKNILVITDFTEAAANILRFANKLATHAQAELVLLHYLQEEALTATAESRALLRLRSFAGRLQQGYPKGKATVVHNECVVRSGSLVSAITDLVNDHHIDLILMPATFAEEAAAYKDLNLLKEINQQVAAPVMLVPPHAEMPAFKSLVYSADFTRLHMGQLKNIISLAASYGATLNLVHVYKRAERTDLVKYKNALKKLCAGVEYPGLSYFLLEEEDYLEGLDEFAQIHEADLLIMAAPNKDLVAHLVSSNYAKTNAYHQQIPVILYNQPKTEACTANCTVCAPQKMRKPNLELVSI